MSSTNLGIICGNDAHKDKLIFCRNCAKHNKPVSKVFYCEVCNPTIKDAHKMHMMDKIQIGSKDFLNNYEKFKGNVKKLLVSEVRKSKNDLSLLDAERKLI